MKTKTAFSFAFSLLVLAATSLTSRAQLVWQVGKDDEAWPQTGVGGGPETVFDQEGGGINDLPGSPESTVASGGADNDYYFAGVYTNTIPSVIAAYIDYTPVGDVPVNELAAERAFAGADNDWRVHFNLPTWLKTNDMLTVTWDPNNLDTTNPDPFYGAQVFFNGLQIQPEIVVHQADGFTTNYTTAQFSLASVNAQVGPGFDNIVSLKGVNHNADGGGNWMGIDYVKLEANVVNPTNAPAALPLLWTVGLKDNGWPVGTGGGANTSFVQENGSISPLPGEPTSTSVAHGADNDYYFAGVYTNVIASVTASYGDYTPVGVVAVNEEAAERAFADADDDLRYHFNLPSTLKPFDLLSVSFAALNLDDPSDANTDVRYGVEVYINGVLVEPQILVRPVDLNTDYTTPQFRLDSVNAQVGPGFDNIVSLKGINYNADGGGNWMGIDYVQLNAGSSSLPPDTNAPTVVSVTRYGDVARLKVTFSELVTAVTANLAANYVLGSSNIISLAVLQPDGTNVILTTAPIAIGTSDSLTVTGVKDLAGNVVASTGNQVSFNSKYQILLVTADPGPLTFAGDQAVLKDLQARGFDVTLTTGTAVPDDGSTAIGKDLVIVSSSLGSGTVIAVAGGAKFLNSRVPVIVWESALEDDFLFQAAGG
ncbi:MAG: Ig-like domain-containing protein, partial [Verrucomicrobiota bacterium]